MLLLLIKKWPVTYTKGMNIPHQTLPVLYCRLITLVEAFSNSILTDYYMYRYHKINSNEVGEIEENQIILVYFCLKVKKVRIS